MLPAWPQSTLEVVQSKLPWRRNWEPSRERELERSKETAAKSGTNCAFRSFLSIQRFSVLGRFISFCGKKTAVFYFLLPTATGSTESCQLGSCYNPTWNVALRPVDFACNLEIFSKLWSEIGIAELTLATFFDLSVRVSQGAKQVDASLHRWERPTLWPLLSWFVEK